MSFLDSGCMALARRRQDETGRPDRRQALAVARSKKLR
jgi:hypothetical protein